MEDNCGAETLLALVGNKSDLPRAVDRTEPQILAQKHSMVYFETCCVTGEGIKDLFELMCQSFVDKTIKDKGMTVTDVFGREKYTGENGLDNRSGLTLSQRDSVETNRSDKTSKSSCC